MRILVPAIRRMHVTLFALLVACSPLSEVVQQPTAQPATEPTAFAQPTADPATPVQPTNQPASTSTVDNQRELIQRTVDQYVTANRTQDRALLEQTVDPASAPLRRYITSTSERDAAYWTSLDESFQLQVGELRGRENGFVQAKIETPNGYVADWVFREVNGAWLLAEPNRTQLGKTYDIETEHFIFRTYAWSESVNEAITEVMEQSYQNVYERLERAPDSKALVTIRPTFGSGAPMSASTVGFYVRSGGRRGMDRIEVLAPESFAFGFYDPQVGWQPSLESTLTHEYAHLVHDRMFTPLYRVPDWMSEGLAEYVAESPRSQEVRAAYRAGNILPLIDPNPTDPIKPQDMQHMLLTEDVSLAYGYAYSLVAYTVEEYGGLEGFWKLNQAYDSSQNLVEALDEAFGISLADYERGWQDWLAQHY